MKSKWLYCICLGVFIITVGIVLMFALNKREEEPIVIETEYKLHKDFIKVDKEYSEERIENSVVLKDYKEYSKYFDDNKISESDIENNNYLLLVVDYMGCSERDVLPTDYKIDGNNINVTVKYKSVCGLCAPVQEYYLLKINKNIENMDVKIDSVAVSRETCDPYVTYKPLIYLYPTKKTNVSVKLSNPSDISFSYPKYNTGWNVTAYPNGKIIFNNREYYGLYWEGLNHTVSVREDGFVVKGEDVTKFLEEKLSLLGLNERESNEFIIYWLDKLEGNKYNYIRFESDSEIDEYMKLEVNPKPDTVIRVWMTYKELDNYIEVKPQVLKSIKRK